MMYPKKVFVKFSAVLLALTATPQLLITVLDTEAVHAQSSSPSPASFPLPESLPADANLRVDGSSSMTVINEALKQRFEERFSDANVELAANGTQPALESLLNGDINLAAIGRALTDDEKAQGLIEVPVSREKIAIIVGPDNPFDGDITFEQFARIFRGEITDWSELGEHPVRSALSIVPTLAIRANPSANTMCFNKGSLPLARMPLKWRKMIQQR